MGAWFGTDGIRGRAGQAPLVPAFLRRLGRALGEQAGAGGAPGAGPLVLVARDTRESGPGISADLEHGLAAAGARVLDLGVVPTPGLPLAMRDRGAALGIVVSASHNPWEDNGVKVFGPGGTKLLDEVEAAVERRVAALGGVEPDGEAATGAHARDAEAIDGAADYVADMTKRFAGLDLSGLALVADCAHGAATATAPPVLRALGARLTVTADAPDGRNINAGCGSTHLGHVAEVVQAAGADLGLAFDGDADRVLMVDAAGRECTGDHMLALLGPALDQAGALSGRTVVATVMSNLGLERVLAGAGLTLLRTPVGDRHVLAAMREGGFALGGEASGHLLFHETPPGPRLGGHTAFLGDGLYTALRVLEVLTATGRDLAAVIDAVPAVPQVLLNVKVAARPPLDSLPAVTAAVAEAEARHGRDVRIVLRYSGTENLARVMVEGTDAGVVDRLSRDLARLWEQAIAGAVP